MLSMLLIHPPLVSAGSQTDTIGTAAGTSTFTVFVLSPITPSATGPLQSIGVNIVNGNGGNINVAIYSDSGGKPNLKLAESGSTPMSSEGWQDVALTGGPTVNSGTQYWIGLIIDTSGRSAYYSIPGTSYLYFGSFGSWPAGPYSTTNPRSYTVNMRITYSTGPPPNDFTITATTTSQTVGAGATATYALSIQYGSSLSATVDLGVTSGCPTGVTCTFSPPSVTGSSTVTLSVPTLPTTPEGTTTITVTATSTSPALSHSVQVQLTVNPAGSYPVYVYAGASKVTVTVTWSGSGVAAIYLAGPGGSPTLSECGNVIYDRVVYVSGSSTPTYIHRVTFTLPSPPTSTQTWNALVSLTGSYTVTIEVNSPSPTT